MNDHGAPVECFWQGETEVLEENSVLAAHRCNLDDTVVGAGRGGGDKIGLEGKEL